MPRARAIVIVITAPLVLITLLFTLPTASLLGFAFFGGFKRGFQSIPILLLSTNSFFVTS